MTVLLALEDIIRLVIYTVHSYITTCCHAFSLIPVCLVLCFTKRCFCSNLCARAGPCYHYNDSASGGCLLTIIFIVAIILILYYTFWIEDILKKIGIQLPSNIFGKPSRNYVSKRRAYNLPTKIDSLRLVKKLKQSNKGYKDEISLREEKEIYDYTESVSQLTDLSTLATTEHVVQYSEVINADVETTRGQENTENNYAVTETIILVEETTQYIGFVENVNVTSYTDDNRNSTDYVL